MMAEKLCTPNIPKLEIVKVPPDSSLGLSLPSLALAARSFTSLAISSSPLRLVPVIVGARRPIGV